MQEAVIGVDIGTTGVRAVVFDLEGRALGESYREVRLSTPRPNRAEQDPEAIVAAVFEVIPQALASAGEVSPVAVGLSSPLHTLLAVDADGRPLTPLHTWADNRAARQAERLAADPSAHDIYRRTGCKAHPLYPLSKLLWLRDEERATFHRAARFVSLKAYLLHRLFGQYRVDTCVASATGLFDIHCLRWDPELLDLVGISADRLDEPCDAATQLQGLKRDDAQCLALPADIPFVVGAGDGPLCNVACGALDARIMPSTIGTSGALRLTQTEPTLDAHERLWCYHLMEGYWILGGAINNGALPLRWFRDQFGQPEIARARQEGRKPYALLEEQAAQAPPGSGGLIFLPYLTGERNPDWNHNARGVFFGLNLSHTRADVIRAMMEGTIFALHRVHQALAPRAPADAELYATGGYVRFPLWLQIQADVFGRPIAVPDISEASALGAARVALHAIGRIPSPFVRPRIVRTFEPDPARHRRYRELDAIAQRVYAHLLDDFDAIARFQTEPSP